MELAGEMMDDTMESALDNDEVEEETNELVDQVGGWVVVVWVWLARVVWGLGGL